MRHTVIVVDDDPWNCEAIAEVLGSDGYAVIATMDGEAAIEAARRTPRPVALILDLMLPKVSGWQVVQALREDVATADIPIITCTASLADAPPGATRHVRKPFDADELLAAVAAVFAEASAPVHPPGP